MTIVVSRDKAWFARLRRLRLRLDGVPVARIGSGRTVELTGSGAPQRLTASIDWVTSDELTVTDPGPDAVVELDLTARDSLPGLLRTFLAPDTVLVLVPAGTPVPAPPPVRPRWRRIGLAWLAVLVLQAVASVLLQGVRGELDPAGLAVRTVGLGLGYAFLIGIGIGILILRRSARGG